MDCNECGKSLTSEEYEDGGRHCQACMDAMKKTKQAGFTLIQFVITIFLMGIVAAIMVPKFVDHTEAARQTVAVQFVDAGNEALRLDFYRQISAGETYTSPFPDDKQKVGKKLRKTNKEALEALLEIVGKPNGFKWILVQDATPSAPPIVGFKF